MKTYPLSAPMRSAVAELVVGYINMEMQMSLRKVRSFERDDIARAIHCERDAVGEVLLELDGSDNGVTVCKEGWPDDRKSN